MSTPGGGGSLGPPLEEFGPVADGSSDELGLSLAMADNQVRLKKRFVFIKNFSGLFALKI